MIDPSYSRLRFTTVLRARKISSISSLSTDSIGAMPDFLSIDDDGGDGTDGAYGFGFLIPLKVLSNTVGGSLRSLSSNHLADRSE